MQLPRGNGNAVNFGVGNRCLEACNFGLKSGMGIRVYRGGVMVSGRSGIACVRE